MAIGPLKKIAAKRASEICSPASSCRPTRKSSLNDQLSPDAYLDLLIEKEQWVDAIRLLASALPKREAVWWAAGLRTRPLCLRMPAHGPRGAESAEAWVYKPTEENRWAAKEAGEKVGYDKPACWATHGRILERRQSGAGAPAERHAFAGVRAWRRSRRHSHGGAAGSGARDGEL